MYLSPYCKSAIPFGSLIPCLAQTTILTLVESQFFFDFTPAMFTALWLEHVLFCIKIRTCQCYGVRRHASCVSSLRSHRYFLKAMSSTKYAQPWLRLGSFWSFKTARRLRRKLASRATNSASTSLYKKISQHSKQDWQWLALPVMKLMCFSQVGDTPGII